jgi:dTDP-4-amino-4,6-dideoxygalactose transaminase
MVVGGEFYYDGRWTLDTPIVETRELSFLNGGKACLIVICKYLLAQGIDTLLLPAYLCPSILSIIRSCGMKADFYRVLPDFSIDVTDLTCKAIGHKAIYFINYFGFKQPSNVQELLATLQRKGAVIIEDNAHSGFWEQSMGDFTFNSMRKLCPYDGGYLATSQNIDPFITHIQPITNRHLPVMREYRRRLGEYLEFGVGDYDELKDLYQRAEEYYETESIITGDEQEKHAIEHLDWRAIKERRRENYLYLLELIYTIPQVVPVFPELTPEVQPMGFPVYIEGGLRDRLFDDLGNQGIGLTIHWDGLLHDPFTHALPGVSEIANRILTLPVDQRVNHKQLDLVVQTMAGLIRGYLS